MPASPEARIRICIGVVTRDRKETVGFLLESLTGLHVPSNLHVELAVIENGPGGQLDDLIRGFARTATQIPVHHFHEPRLGLVYARNAALAFALANRFDRLAFVDDDEIVEPGWLSALHDELVRRNAHIAGGPVRAFVRSKPVTTVQRMLWKAYLARTRRVERVSATRKDRGREGAIMLATNNWMMNLAFCRDHDLSFDMTGGEDSGFFRAAKRKGATTAWAPDAVVRECVPLERLTIRYQFRRARDQSLVSFYREYEARSALAWLRVPLSACYKFAAGAILLSVAPVTGGGSLLAAIRAFGAASGRVGGLMGLRSSHYRKTTGS